MSGIWPKVVNQIAYHLLAPGGFIGGAHRDRMVGVDKAHQNAHAVIIQRLIEHNIEHPVVADHTTIEATQAPESALVGDMDLDHRAHGHAFQ